MLPDLICFSHLRWDFVWQRPQHLMMRGAQTRRVWLVEEPETTDEASYLDVRTIQPSLSVVVSRLTSRLNRVDRMRAQTRLLVDAGDARGLTDVAAGTPGRQALLL